MLISTLLLFLMYISITRHIMNIQEKTVKIKAANALLLYILILFPKKEVNII